jgi:hypothetical protein
MKKISFLIVALVIVALAVFVAVGLDGNKAGAYSSGWGGGCATCHPTSAGTGLHTLATHKASACTVCHAQIGDTPALSKCVACHGSAPVISAKPTHTANGCAAVGCHPREVPTTTTVPPASTTTTAPPASTTTTAGQTTTTAHQTTTTVHVTTTTAPPASTTTTTAAPTTTTTVPENDEATPTG